MHLPHPSDPSSQVHPHPFAPQESHGDEPLNMFLLYSKVKSSAVHCLVLLSFGLFPGKALVNLLHDVVGHAACEGSHEYERSAEPKDDSRLGCVVETRVELLAEDVLTQPHSTEDEEGKEESIGPIVHHEEKDKERSSAREENQAVGGEVANEGEETNGSVLNQPLGEVRVILSCQIADIIELFYTDDQPHNARNEFDKD